MQNEPVPSAPQQEPPQPITPPEPQAQPEPATQPAPNTYFTAGPPIEPVDPAVNPTSAIGSGPAAPGEGALAPKKKKKGLIIGAIVAGALVLLGGGGAAAYNLWYQNPDKVISDALVNAMTAKTMTATGSFDFKNDDYEIQLEVSSKGKENIGELEVSLDYTYDDRTISIEGAGMMSQEGDLYVKVDNAQELADAYFSVFMMGGSTPTAFEPLIEKIDGSWIKISKEDLGDMSEDFEASRACYQEMATSLTENRSWSTELTNLYQANKFVVIEEKLNAKDVNGVGSLGYRLGFDNTAASSFATGLADTEFGKKLADCNESVDYDDIAESLGESSDSESTGQFDVWVSRFGHEFTELSYTDSNDSGDGTMVANPVFNKEVTITTPTESISVQELQADFESASNAYMAEMQASYQY